MVVNGPVDVEEGDVLGSLIQWSSKILEDVGWFDRCRAHAVVAQIRWSSDGLNRSGLKWR